MSRFPTSRRNQILAWTGAALAWGTTFLASKVEPDRIEKIEGKQAVEATAQVAAPMPQIPQSGLTVIRYQPPEKVEQAFVPATVNNPTPPVPAQAAPAPAPAPVSSGS